MNFNFYSIRTEDRLSKCTFNEKLDIYTNREIEGKSTENEKLDDERRETQEKNGRGYRKHYSNWGGLRR